MQKIGTATPKIGPYKIAGYSSDGVAILKAGRATHFTDKQLKKAFKVLRESSSGQFGAAARKPASFE